MSLSPFRQVKASAGSGKTYALTLRFLELLAGAEEEDPGAFGRACAAGEGGCPPRSYYWPEILAITFTNKAAAEMRERVVRALKSRALGREETAGAALPPARARRLLLEILRHTQHLGIRTIDSLLSLLVRVFALEHGLAPDFDVVFEEGQALDELIERFLERCAPGGTEEALYVQALRTMLEHENKDGFWLAEPLRQRLAETTRMVLSLPEDQAQALTTDQKRMADLLAMSFEDMRRAAQAMAEGLEAARLEPNAHFTKLLAKCAEAELFGGLPDSKFLQKDSLGECLLTKSRPRLTQAAEDAYTSFKDACARYAREEALLSSAYALAPCVAMARLMTADLSDLQRRRGFVLGSQMAGLAGSALDGGIYGFGVPEAFCRLGDRLHHLLVDEFQDTSRAQWGAAQPLASECLAKGGSLFCVGDVKQAIYAWRGGDAALFDEVAGDSELTAMSGGAERSSLPCNWRSRPEIVGFNNRIFGRLGQTQTATELADTLLPEAPEDIRASFGERLCAAFADCAQALPKRTSEPEPGRVQLRLLPARRAEDAVEQGLDALVQTLLGDVLPRRRPGDVAVLVRTGAHADLVCERLVQAGVPIITENSLLLARHPVVRQLIALLRLLDAPPDDVAFLALLLGGDLFQREAGLDEATLLDWAANQDKAEGRGGLLSRFRDDFPEVHARLLAPFLLRTGLMRPYDLLQAALEGLQVLARHPEAELYVRRLLEVVHLAEAQGMGTLPRFLEFWDRAGAEEKVPLPESADAVRILTIHKSKGLQFPVCFVPFHNWSAGPRGEHGLVELHGHMLLTRLTKTLGRPYHEHLAKNLLEQANLLYVAWTRAEEELYAFVPAAGGKRSLGAVPLLLEQVLEIPPEEAGLELGCAPAPGPAATCSAEAAPGQNSSAPDVADSGEIAPRSTPPEFLAWLPRLRVFRHAVEDAGFDERLRGTVAHKAVELLRPPGGVTDPEQDSAAAQIAASLAMGEFPQLRSLGADERAKLQAELEGMLLWLLGDARLRPHLGGQGAEQSILTDDDALLRPDLLRFAPGGPVVLEFKTGRAAPEHARQLSGYLSLARELAQSQGLPHEPAGWLVYLDRRVVEAVAAPPATNTGGQA